MMQPPEQSRTELIPAGRLASMLQEAAGPACRALGEFYGKDCDVPGKARVCLGAVEAFCREFGAEAPVFVARTTGRINLLGMHVDHRGGLVNPIAVKEAFFIVEPRADDEVRVCSAEPGFGPRRFTIHQELPRRKISDWDAWTQQELENRSRAGGHAGDWANYIKSAGLYLQHLHTRDDGRFDPPLRGMNLAVNSTIPMAAGLSSSSAMVVGAAEACAHVNALEMSPMEMAEATRLAEWYVGTRGGGGDQAAIKFGKKDHVLQIGSFPLSVRSAPFPPGYSLVLANSLVEARKQEGARDAFNQRVAAYDFGLLMLQGAFPQHAARMVHLRDVNPATLGVSEAQAYRMILTLPPRCSRREVTEALPDRRERVERVLRSHAEPPEGYLIRQVCAYGIAECIRSEMAGELLRRGDVKGFGELISMSHDGDRVTRLLEGRRVPYDNSLSDAALDALIADAESGDPGRIERARLWRQPGGYGVSTPEQDTLVDIALGLPGVAGAGLVGAGLGGTIIALVEEQQAEATIDAMAKGFYAPRGLPVAAEVARPVGGAAVLSI